MKIKDGFILREVAGSYLVGAAVKQFNGMINLNDTGAFLWKLLENGADEDGMVKALLAEYEVEEEVARADVKAFVQKLTEAGLLA